MQMLWENSKKKKSDRMIADEQKMVRPMGFEPMTFRFVAEHSIQLS